MEAMKKSFLLVNLVFALLVLASAQVNVFTPFDFETEFPQNSEAASKFSQKSQYFPHSNPDEPSLLSQSELSQETKYFPRSNDEETSSFFESDRPYDSLETQSVFNSNAKESEQPFDSLETQNFPGQTSQFSESGFSKTLDFPSQSFEVHKPRKTKPPPPLPSPSEAPAPSPVEAPAPSPVEAPAPSPAPSKNTCKHNCFKKCSKIEFPILRRLCHYVCQRKCLLNYSVQIYNCTARCAESMPAIFKSDKKKADGYVNYCYTKCIKKF